jgi:hypothetical protein
VRRRWSFGMLLLQNSYQEQERFKQRNTSTFFWVLSESFGQFAGSIRCILLARGFSYGVHF